MLMLNSKKGDFGATILIAVIGVVIVFGTVLYFFYVFKAHVTLVAREEYIWNKVEEVPLDLLSMDIENELFVSRMNKAYYGYGNKTELIDKIHNNIMKQLFYFLEGTQYPFKVIVQVNGITLANVTDVKDCKIEVLGCLGIHCSCICSEDCTYPNKDLGLINRLVETCESKYIISDCLYVGRVEYSAEFPFPLTFNGTDKFVDKLLYNVVEEK